MRSTGVWCWLIYLQQTDEECCTVTLTSPHSSQGSNILTQVQVHCLQTSVKIRGLICVDPRMLNYKLVLVAAAISRAS